MSAFGSVFNSAFILRLVASFIIGGLYVALVLRVSEKFGSKLGGVFAGMPSTVLVSLIFIALTQGKQALQQTIIIIPAGLGMSCLFLTLLVYSHKRSKFVVRALAFMVWIAAMLMLVRFRIGSMSLSVLASAIILLLCLKFFAKHPDMQLPRCSLRKSEVLCRIIFSGVIITTSVLIAKLFGPVWGGVVASFPAASFSAFVLLTRRHGIEFSTSVVKKVPYGFASNVCFLTALFVLLPVVGIIWAMVLAYGISFSVAAIILSVS